MTDHPHPHPNSPNSPTTWENPNEDRDPWEERPREVAFWTIPLLLTMLSFAIVIIYFSVTR